MRAELCRQHHVEVTTVPEVGYGRGEAIGPEFRVPVDQRYHPPWLGLEQKPPGYDTVAADIHQCPAAGFEDVPDVGRVEIRVAEEHLDRPQLADASGTHKLAYSPPL